MMNNITHYARITATEEEGSLRYKTAQNLFKSLLVAERRKRLLDQDAPVSLYKVREPSFTPVPRVSWSEVVKHAFRNGISIMTI